ncbi:hypothetical protein HOD83_03290 [Candidatus Woesearchaeota archaeon]|nr:hypothetical protein [Candidatus Woesearchaeota archaeon]MBT4114404.1 hypothetical protein [Candidatus Woesearchaeota archaeon]MBT4248580.1 hypothetical protein [Candidatus Woesearchaeota archaeon]
MITFPCMNWYYFRESLPFDIDHIQDIYMQNGFAAKAKHEIWSLLDSPRVDIGKDRSGKIRAKVWLMTPQCILVEHAPGITAVDETLKDLLAAHWEEVSLRNVSCHTPSRKRHSISPNELNHIKMEIIDRVIARLPLTETIRD